ncbi:MAG TPA: LysR family transcriptional regulator [Acidimicrobiales bacterium]|nr:LysR family transcriptional regulator [Acidimicrobiales bacterium]
MTLTQLEAFVLVARLGSVRAAADALGVSEPAVSGALAALRNHLGDPLVTRTPTGMVLSPAGQRLVGIASQMVNLAAEVEPAIRQAQGAPVRLRVAATSTVAEFVAPPLLAAFTARTPSVEANVGTCSSDEMAALLHDRLADVCFGPRLTGEQARGIDCEPMMRYRLAVVASPAHRLAGADGFPWQALVDEDWLVDPSGTDRSTEVGMLLEHLHVGPERVRVFPSLTAAWLAAAEGEGVAPAIAHLVLRDLKRGALVQLNVTSTPVQLLWHVSTLPAPRQSPGVAALRRFLGTPEAMQAMHHSDGGVPASRFRPPVYVTLWS